MRLYNADVDEAERNYSEEEDPDHADEAEEDPCRSFFELRQRTMAGMELNSVFRIASLGLLRKLRTNTKGSVLYAEVEDALGSHFRLLDADNQKFAALHETLREASERQSKHSVVPNSAAAAASTTALSILSEGMREIAVVLLACGEMQKRALDLKLSSQHSISESDMYEPALVSFSKFADFLEKALAFGDQLRRKHVELHQLRMRAMASVVEARTSAGATSDPAPIERTA